MIKIKKLLTYFLISGLIVFFPPISSRSAALDTISDSMTRFKASTLSSHDITFDLDGSNTFATTETLTIDFDEDGGEFVVDGASSAIADFGFNDGTERTIVGVDGDCTGHSAANDVAVGINDTTGVVTFEACGSFSASGAGATVNIEYGTAAGGTNRVTNPAAATYVIDIGGTSGDDGKFAIAIIAEDQIPVTASVDPSITLTVAVTTLALGTLSTSSVSTSGANDITVGTNGTNGYTITVRDEGSGAADGLYNTPATYLVASADAVLAIGTEGYGAQCQKTAGDGACDATFNYWGTDQVGGLQRTLDTFASYGSKPSGSDTFQIRVKAAISTATEAGDYNDTATVIATGNF